MTTATAPRRRTLSGGRSKFLFGVTGSLVILLGWTLLAKTFFATSGTLPTPVRILAGIAHDGWAFYGPNVSITLREALLGYTLGVGAALALSALVIVFPRLEGAATQVSVVTYCIPIVAIGPAIYLLLGAPKQGQPSGTAVALAAMAVFFTTLTNALLGLKSADKSGLELVTAYGGTAWQRLFKVQIPAALPAIISGLKIAAPAALLGAILGEYVGGVDKGLGPAMVNAQQQMNADRTWAVAIVSAIVAGLWFAALSIFERLVHNYHGGVLPAGAQPSAVNRRRPLRTIGVGVASAAGLLLGWQLALTVFKVSPYVGKGPVDVFRFLFVDPDAEVHRVTVLTDIGQTLADASIGFVAGLLAATLLACLFVLFPMVEQAILPFAMLVRSVPLVALAPVVILICGRSTLTLAVLGGVIVFFPALVNLSMGLKSAPTALTELIAVYGGNARTVLFKVRIAACLPALFASIRIAIPGAIAGAILAEWLATGTGVGSSLIAAIGRSNNAAVWTYVAAITATSLLLYSTAVVIERAVVRARNT